MKLTGMLGFSCILVASYIVFASGEFFQLNNELELAVQSVAVQKEHIRSLESELASLNTPEALIKNSVETYVLFDANDNAYQIAME